MKSVNGPHRILDVNAWHNLDRVVVQGRSGRLLLVQYVHRSRIAGRRMTEGGVTLTRGPVYRWAWVPANDVDVDPPDFWPRT